MKTYYIFITSFFLVGCLNLQPANTQIPNGTPSSAPSISPIQTPKEKEPATSQSGDDSVKINVSIVNPNPSSVPMPSPGITRADVDAAIAAAIAALPTPSPTVIVSPSPVAIAIGGTTVSGLKIEKDPSVTADSVGKAATLHDGVIKVWDYNLSSDLGVQGAITFSFSDAMSSDNGDVIILFESQVYSVGTDFPAGNSSAESVQNLANFLSTTNFVDYFNVTANGSDLTVAVKTSDENYIVESMFYIQSGAVSGMNYINSGRKAKLPIFLGIIKEVTATHAIVDVSLYQETICAEDWNAGDTVSVKSGGLISKIKGYGDGSTSVPNQIRIGFGAMDCIAGEKTLILVQPEQNMVVTY